MHKINQNINVEYTENDNHPSFSSLYKFLGASLVLHIYLLVIALKQIFFETGDISPRVAGFSIGFILVTIYYFTIYKKYNKQKTENDKK